MGTDFFKWGAGDLPNRLFLARGDKARGETGKRPKPPNTSILSYTGPVRASHGNNKKASAEPNRWAPRWRKLVSSVVLKAGQRAGGGAAGLLVCGLRRVLPQGIPNGGKLALLLVGLAILAASVLIFASQRGGVRCPNCGARWGGNPFGMAARTHEGIFRCPRCGTMIDMR